MLLIVPRLYAWKSAKWLKALEFVLQDRPGLGDKPDTTPTATRGPSSGCGACWSPALTRIGQVGRTSGGQLSSPSRRMLPNHNNHRREPRRRRSQSRDFSVRPLIPIWHATSCDLSLAWHFEVKFPHERWVMMQAPIELEEPTASPPADQPAIWYLEGFSDTEKSSSLHVVLGHFPFYIGRSPGLSLTLNSSQVSKRHATIDRRDTELWLHDLGSKNGTGVNGRRITDPVKIQAGDQIQIAQLQFQVGFEYATPTPPATSGSTSEMCTVEALLSQILESGDVVPHYQPIVRLSNGTRLGYEVLARTSSSGSQPASVLFFAAKRLGVESQVSDLCRREGLRQGKSLPGRPTLFVNTHATELAHVPFLKSLRNFREQTRVTPIVLEVQEAQVRDLGTIRDLGLVARAYGLKLAFDNFGGNESRLRQLLELQPDFVKFDFSLIHGLDRAPQHRQRCLADLVQQTRAAGVAAIAEGVESRGEFFQCRQLGFDFAQGLFVGRPMCGADLIAANMKTELERSTSGRTAHTSCDHLLPVGQPSEAGDPPISAVKSRRTQETGIRLGKGRTDVESARRDSTLKSPRNASGRDDDPAGNPRKPAQTNAGSRRPNQVVQPNAQVTRAKG